MKKLALTSVCTLALASAALAQGTIQWNIIPTDYTAQTNSQTYSPLLGGGSTGSGAVGGTFGSSATGGGAFYVELLYQAYSGNGGVAGSGNVAQPTTLAQLAAWTDSGYGATNNPASAGKTITINSSSQAIVPWNPGTTDSLMLVEWSANLGTTFAAALATLESPTSLSSLVGQAFIGTSTTGYITPNAVGTSGAPIFSGTQGNSANGIPINGINTQLYLVPVPEPSTIAMAAFGGLSLLALRRKK